MVWASPRRVGRFVGLATAATVAAITLTACTSTLSEMPTAVGGLPAGTPERPATPVAYPAVHDMPPQRDDVVLTDTQQKKIQADLLAARDRQSKQSGAASRDQQ
jgi:hypothetical protein